MRITWPYPTLPPFVQAAINQFHSDELITIETMNPGLNAQDPWALAELLKLRQGQDGWIYSVNNLLQIEIAMRGGYTFRVVEMFFPDDHSDMELAAIFQVDPMQGLHRIWANERFRASTEGIPKLDVQSVC